MEYCGDEFISRCDQYQQFQHVLINNMRATTSLVWDDKQYNGDLVKPANSSLCHYHEVTTKHFGLNTKFIEMNPTFFTA